MIRASFLQYLAVSRSYAGAFVAFIIISTVLAIIPILLGQYIAGADFIRNFEASGGGRHPIAFIIIGMNGWTFISYALWDYSTYMREEQQAGTLESLFLTPANQILVITGRSIVSAILALASFIIGTFTGLLIFDTEILLSQDVFLVLVGMMMLFFSFLPMMGISLLLGALIMRFKEIYNITSIIHFALGTLMGVTFPILLLPFFIQFLGFFFPGTWMMQDLRYIMTGSPPMVAIYGLESLTGIYPAITDGVAIVILAVIWGVLGWLIFNGTIGRMKRQSGIGTY